MHKMLVTGFAASLGIGLAASPFPADADPFSAKGPVIAILAGELYVGEAEGHLDGSGTIAIHSQINPGVTCRGQFTSSAELGGTGQMQCSDSTTATFHFQRLTMLRGHGSGNHSRGSMSFTYGLTADESRTYLKLPAGKKLEHDGKQLALVDIPPAQDVAPDVLLSAVTLEVIAIIRQDKDFQAGNPTKVADLVETKILPHFDFARMTRIAVARNWRLATPEQQKALTAEFKTLLVRTYSTALSSYRDQVIEYKPLRAAPGATEVTVKSEIKQPGTERMTIDYDIEKTPAGWKVYDIKVAGISLVSTYRESFSSRVRDGGIEGLIKSLSDKNRQDDSRFKSDRSLMESRWS
jgi:phospholipid transport system substrate-binding protein